MVVPVFTDEDLKALRRFPEIGREELFRFFTLAPADVRDREKPWDGSGGDVERLTWAGESGVPAGEVAGEVVVEDAGADLQEQVGAAG